MNERVEIIIYEETTITATLPQPKRPGAFEKYERLPANKAFHAGETTIIVDNQEIHAIIEATGSERSCVVRNITDIHRKMPLSQQTIIQENTIQDMRATERPKWKYKSQRYRI